MIHIRAVSMAVLFFGVIGAGPSLANEFLSAEELKELYTDVRVDSVTRRGSPMVFNFKPDGTYLLQVKTPGGVTESAGKWWVEEPNKFCRTRPQSKQSCVRHKKTATGYDRYSTDGGRELQSAWKISKAAGLQQTAQINKLPKILKGHWNNPNSGHGGEIVVKLLRMDSATKGTVEVEWQPYCGSAETTITFTRGYWRFSGVDCSNNSGPLSLSAQVRQVEGEKRMEGFYGRGAGRTVVLGWE